MFQYNNSCVFFLLAIKGSSLVISFVIDLMAPLQEHNMHEEYLVLPNARRRHKTKQAVVPEFNEADVRRRLQEKKQDVIRQQRKEAKENELLDSFLSSSDEEVLNFVSLVAVHVIPLILPKY